MERLEDCEAEFRAAAEAQGRVNVELPLQLQSCLGSVNACVADCVADSTCSAITASLLGRHTDPNAEPTPPGTGQFSLCLQTCMNLAQSEN